MNNFCSLCPNGCKINKDNQKGLCGTDGNIRIAKFYLHPFEEPMISGEKGSGTIFFCGCSLKCVFCQNFEVSRNLTGKEISIDELAEIFKKLEDMGATTINLVNPTHYADKIIKAFNVYRPKAPVVYNTHGYERIEMLEKVNEFVDVYLPDIKFFSPTLSKRYTGKENYFEVSSKALEFMINSKPLKFGEDGLLKQGVIVRHLVLPQATSDSKKVLDWFYQFKDKAILNVMSQYTPFGEIDSFPELKRKITAREYNSVIDYALSLGIENMLYQKRESANEVYIPKWDF